METLLTDGFQQPTANALSPQLRAVTTFLLDVRLAHHYQKMELCWKCRPRLHPRLSPPPPRLRAQHLSFWSDSSSVVLKVSFMITCTALAEKPGSSSRFTTILHFLT